MPHNLAQKDLELMSVQRKQTLIPGPGICCATRFEHRDMKIPNLRSCRERWQTRMEANTSIDLF